MSPDPLVKRVVLVEDCPTDAELLALVFDDAGAQIEWVHVTTKPALRAALIAAHVDLVISDYHVPGFDGLQALTIVRELAPGVPFVFCCGEIDADFERRVTDAGAHACVTKREMWKVPEVAAVLFGRG